MSKTVERKEVLTEEEIKGTQEYIEKYFPIVPASTFSIEDEAFKHEPKTDRQKQFKDMLFTAIKSGLSDFRAQRMDPSLDEEGNICFCVGKSPAIRRSIKWWDENAKKFMPEKESRIGSVEQRIAFLGALIKHFVEEKVYTVEEAWKAVCDQSKYLGYYADSPDSPNIYQSFDRTGSRKVGKWYDLGNTYKICFDDQEGGFVYVGGHYESYGNESPLADIGGVEKDKNCQHKRATGWIVLSV